jgi:hypothetical protein
MFKIPVTITVNWGNEAVFPLLQAGHITKE